MPSKGHPGDLQSLPSWSQNHEKSIQETFWTHLGQNLVEPRFWMTLPWFWMVFQELDRPWTIKISLKTVPGTIPETSTVRRRSINRFPMKNDAPRPPKWDPKFMKNRTCTFQGSPLGSQGHSQVAQMSPRRPRSIKKQQKWRLRAPKETSMTSKSNH